MSASAHIAPLHRSPIRRLARWAGPTGPLSLATFLLLAALVVPPLAMLLQVSLTETSADGSAGAFTLRHYAELVADPHLYASIANSLTFAIGATLVSLLFGGVLAWVVERTNCADESARLSHHHRLAGHAVRPLRHRLAVPARPLRPVQ